MATTDPPPSAQERNNAKPKPAIKLPAVVIVASFIIIAAGMMYAASMVNSILMAMFIGIIFSTPIQWLQKMKVPKFLALAIVLVAIVGLFFGLGELVGASLASFSENAQKYGENLNSMGRNIIDFLAERGIHISTDELSHYFQPSKIMSFTASVLGQLGGFMGNALMILFLAIFLLLEVDLFSSKTKAIMKGATDSLSYFNTIGRSIRHYLSIKTLTSLMTGILIWLSLLIIGVDYAIIWGLLAFLLNYIPNIGSIIAAIPAVLFALIQLGFGGMFWSVVAFVAVNLVIGNVVEPKLMGKSMGLSTFVVFLSLIFWGYVLGTVGMFLSVPLTMAIKIMLEESPKTTWVAILLSDQKEARAIIEKNQKPE